MNRNGSSHIIHTRAVSSEPVHSTPTKISDNGLHHDQRIGDDIINQQNGSENDDQLTSIALQQQTKLFRAASSFRNPNVVSAPNTVSPATKSRPFGRDDRIDSNISTISTITDNSSDGYEQFIVQSPEDEATIQQLIASGYSREQAVVKLGRKDIKVRGT
jgi:hypothetical protein